MRLSVDALPEPLREFSVGQEGDLHILQVQDYAQVEEVLAALRRSQVSILELEVLQADLEDVFVQLMHKN